MLAILACGGTVLVFPGCLAAVAPTGGRLLGDDLLDMLLNWVR